MAVNSFGLFERKIIDAGILGFSSYE